MDKAADMVTLTINGTAVQVPPHMTILGAAKRAGFKIPTLCYLKGINDSASCRICVVEVAGQEQLVTACNTTVQEGMEVRTRSPKVLAARTTNMQLLLSQHHTDCTACLRSGNCSLQSLANDLNILDNPFAVEYEPDDWNRHNILIRDASKCIKCLRCVQVCDHIQASHVWALKDRAGRQTVGVRDGLIINDAGCTLCGQCITHCPVGALHEHDHTGRVEAALADPDKVVCVQIAPSVRTAWAEQLGLSHEQADVNKLVAALRQVGFDYVFDTDFAADETIMEEAAEFVERITHAQDYRWPMFTSCCPGWVRFCKQNYPEFTDNLSTAKSPMQMFGATTKSYFAQVAGIDPDRIYTVAIMPCLAKKVEAAYPVFNDTESASGHDMDAVLTTREAARLIKRYDVDVQNLEESEFDRPFGKASGAGEIFGATGGVMEAALRTAYFDVTGENPAPNAFTGVRGVRAAGHHGEGTSAGYEAGGRQNTTGQLAWKEASYDVAGTPVRVAVASGLANAAALLEAIKSGAKQYDFVEVMACPGGCVGGGGQPIHDGRECAFERGEILYGLDERNHVRFSHENPDIKQAYADYFDHPLSERSEHLLHTDHHAWHMPGELDPATRA
jgi:NADH-quinone oxidoreductase subunit G